MHLPSFSCDLSDDGDPVLPVCEKQQGIEFAVWPGNFAQKALLRVPERKLRSVRLYSLISAALFPSIFLNSSIGIYNYMLLFGETQHVQDLFACKSHVG